MDYRDWGSGELVRRARRHDEPADGPGSGDGTDYRTPARTRAARRRPGTDSAERYLPDWARGEPSIGGGRHRHADDDEPASRPRTRWQNAETTSSWQRVTETGYADQAPGHRGREATRHRSTEPLRSLDAADPEPASGRWSLGSYPEDRPARHSAGTGRRRARDDDTGAHRSSPGWYDEPDAEPVTPGRWSGMDQAAAPDEWTDVPAADPWDRGPAVDPWARPDDTSAGAWRWDGGDDGGTGTGQWGRLTDDTRGWSRTADPDPDEPADTDPRYGQRDTFWSGTRLAGDDPRWMDTPAAAPRSPAVEYPSAGARSGTAPARRAERRGDAGAGSDRWTTATGTGGRAGSAGTGRRGGASSAERWGTTGSPARRGSVTTPRRAGADRRRSPTIADRAAIRRLERHLVDGERPGLGPALLSTAAWYAAPLLVLFGWLLTLDGRVPAGCVTDVTGGGCESPRTQAVASVVTGAPQFGAALLTSLLIAVVLRRAGTWRAATVGLISAVVGGGLSTVLFSALSDRPLG